MNIKITYPTITKHALQRQDIIRWAKWPFLAAAYVCPIVNLWLGGAAWSVVVLWSLWLVWSLGLSTDLVEYNRISQFIKLIVNAAILLILIDVLLAPGWAATVVPIVCFGGLTVAGVLFFTDLDKQKQNVMPMLVLSAISFMIAAVWLLFWRQTSGWSLIVMGALSLALLVACFFVLGFGLLRECKKRFHIK